MAGSVILTGARTPIGKLSGSLAGLYIQAGEADIVVAGGMESMTNAPYLLPKARAGYRMGDGAVVDSMMYDGLFCAIDQMAMGAGTEKYARTAEILQRKGDPVLFSEDEGVRGGTTLESLGALRPAFDKAGNITAGNASQISDGGSAVIVCSEAAAEKLGIDPLGRIIGYGQVAGPDPSLLNQPAAAINQALERSKLSVGDLDLFELNEAFAAVGVASMDRLGITSDITNVNGGAIALGHPIGMSGNRVALHLLHELKRRGGGKGAAALCGGGGQGDALLVETI